VRGRHKQIVDPSPGSHLTMLATLSHKGRGYTEAAAGSGMSHTISLRLVSIALLALSLAACATRNEAPASAGLTEDDDKFCQANGTVAVGSPQYVYCRRDRDAARNAAIAKANRKQEDLGDWMLNHPDIH